jgi:spore coat protein H
VPRRATQPRLYELCQAAPAYYQQLLSLVSNSNFKYNIMRKTFTCSIPFLSLLLLLISTVSAAADTLDIAPHYYHIDHKKKIILVNKKVETINSEVSSVKSHLFLGATYAFSQPVLQVKTDSSYEVKLADVAYTVYFTQLPVLSIKARQPIVDTPSRYARFALSQPEGALVESDMGIEIRGGSSQANPKKSFELSFWADTTGVGSRDVGLLGMRTDNKYNLQALYNEPLRVRSKVSNELWQEIHQIYYKNLEPDAKNGIALEYVEVFLNDEYQGIYALGERVDRKQLKLKKYNNGIVGELYKGAYWDGAVTFAWLPPYDNTSETWGGFEYKHPEEQTDWRNLYDFVDFVENSSDQVFYSTYQQKFKLSNAVDYYIFLNLTRAADNTGKNLYIAKYKKGEPYYYVPWDLDGVFGTDWTGATTGPMNDILSNGFYKRLMQDCSPNGFRALLRSRWAELRATVVTKDHIMAKFRANSTYLATNNTYEREHRAWDEFRADTTQLTYISSWLSSRLRFLDATFSQACAPLATAPSAPARLLKLYPNPTSDFLFVEFEGAPFELIIRNMSGREVLRTALKGSRNQVDIRQLGKGLYMATVQSATVVRTEKLLVN